MSVIAQLRVLSDSFELGRILDVTGSTTIELENMVPLGQKAIPFFSVQDNERENFEQRVRDHPSVERVSVVSNHEKGTLYALDWRVSRDIFLQGL